MKNFNFLSAEKERIEENRLYTSFLVKHKQQNVLIKVLNPHVGDDVLEHIARDLKQVERAGEMPGIAKLLSYQLESSKHKYIIREYVAGQNLIDYIKNEKPDRHAAIDLCLKISVTMEALEKMSLHHACLTPENIIIQEGEVILTDAYINKVRYPSQALYTDLPLFSLFFLPPEYFIKEGKLDIVSDVYSLGCVLHYLVYGKPPFASDNRASVLQAHLWDDHIDDDLIGLLTAKIRSSRCQSMGELKSLLRNSLEQKTVEMPKKAQEQRLNHAIVSQLLHLALTGQNKALTLRKGSLTTEFYVQNGFIRYVETVKPSDQFGHYLVSIDVFDDADVQEFFPYLNNRKELIEHILAKTSSHENMDSLYQHWIKHLLFKCLLDHDIAFRLDDYDASSLPSVQGYSLNNCFADLLANYWHSIKENADTYLVGLEQPLTLACDLQDLPKDLDLSQMDVATLSRFPSKTSVADVLSISYDNKDTIKASIVKFLFHGLLCIDRPVQEEKAPANTQAQAVQAENKAQQPASGQEPNKLHPSLLGPLRKQVDRSSVFHVKVMKNQAAKTDERKKVYYFEKKTPPKPPAAPEQEAPVKKEFFSQTRSAAPGAEKPTAKKQEKKNGMSFLSDTQIIQQKKIICSSLLDSAKEHYGNLRFSQALEDITEALRIASSNPTLLHWKARILSRIPQQTAEAERYFEKALEKNPNNHKILEDFGIYLVHQGKQDKAGRFLHQCLKMNPASQRAQDALKELKNGKGEKKKFLKGLFKR